MFASFSPTQETKVFAKNYSLLCLAYFLVVIVMFFIRNRASMAEKTNWLRSNFKYYSYLVFGCPLIAILISYSNYLGWSKGIPSIYTNLVMEDETVSVMIIKKELWGKRDRYQRVYISGFTDGFPVRESFYNSVKIGDSVNVIVKQSRYGSSISFSSL